MSRNHVALTLFSFSAGLLLASLFGCCTLPTKAGHDEKEAAFKANYAQAVMCKALCDASEMSVASWHYAEGLTGQCVCVGSIAVEPKAVTE